MPESLPPVAHEQAPIPVTFATAGEIGKVAERHSQKRRHTSHLVECVRWAVFACGDEISRYGSFAGRLRDQNDQGLWFAILGQPSGSSVKRGVSCLKDVRLEIDYDG
jgi:hypothetical protein